MAALALSSGVHRSTLSRWEQGKSTPFIDELTRVMDALNLSAGQRQACYQSLEAPRAIQAAKANPGSANSAISTGELLRALRLRAKVTQAEAAKAAGVSQVQIAHWENSGATPSGTQLHALCFAYRVNDDELLFLTTRGWKTVEPLPKDMGALECVAGDVEFEGSTDNRSGLYLALDARFQEMHRAGKLNEDEASRVHGHYGLWLLTRFDELPLAYQIGKPGIDSLLQGQETLRWMQQETLHLAIQCSLRFDRIGDAIAILQRIAPRVPRAMRSVWFDLAATVAEQAGDVKQAISYQEKAIATSGRQCNVFLHRKALREILCRSGRFQEALAFVEPPDPEEKRPLIHLENLLSSAQVVGNLGERAEAERYLSQARELSQRTQIDDVFAKRAGSVIRLLEG